MSRSRRAACLRALVRRRKTTEHSHPSSPRMQTVTGACTHHGALAAPRTHSHIVSTVTVTSARCAARDERGVALSNAGPQHRPRRSHVFLRSTGTDADADAGEAAHGADERALEWVVSLGDSRVESA